MTTVNALGWVLIGLGVLILSTTAAMIIGRAIRLRERRDPDQPDRHPDGSVCDCYDPVENGHDP